MASKIIGLDIGHYGVKAAVMSTSLRGFELSGFVSAKYADASKDPEAADVAEAIDKALAGIVGQKQFVVNIFDERVSYKQLSLPFSEIHMLERAIPNALDEIVPFDLSQKHWDFERTKAAETGESQVLSAIVEPKELEGLLETLKARGIDPKAVTTGPLSLINLYRQILEPKPSLELVIDVGHKLTNFVALKQGEVVEIRTAAWGARDVTQNIAKYFDIDFERSEQVKHELSFLSVGTFVPQNEEETHVCKATEEGVAPLMREIMFTLELVSNKIGEDVQSVWITGGGAKLKNLDLYIWDKTGIKCEQLKLLSPDFNKLTTDADESLMAVPLGLATYGIGFKGKLINLRKDVFAYSAEKQYFRRQATLGIIGLFVLIMFAAANVATSFWALSHEEKKLEEQLEKATKRVLGKPIGNVKRALAMINEAIGGKTGDEELPIPELPVTFILAEIGNRLKIASVDSMLTEVNIKMLRKNINAQMKGTTDSIPSVGKIEEALASFPCFKKITPGATRTAVGSTRIEFSFEFDVNCDGVKLQAALDEQSEAKNKEKQQNASGTPGFNPPGNNPPAGTMQPPSGLNQPPQGGAFQPTSNVSPFKGTGSLPNSQVNLPPTTSPLSNVPPATNGITTTLQPKLDVKNNFAPANNPSNINQTPPNQNPTLTPMAPKMEIQAPGSGALNFGPSSDPNEGKIKDDDAM